MTICFTGHRPNKLPGGYDWDSIPNLTLMFKISEYLINLIEANPDKPFHFVTGGALGVDQMAFHVCHKLKFIEDNITLEMAIPFKHQDANWIDESKKIWHSHCSLADKITEVDKLPNYQIKGYQEEIYYPAKMQKRNEYMVDKSDIVIAIWDGTAGGTGNCVNYAKRKKKEIVIMNPKLM